MLEEKSWAGSPEGHRRWSGKASLRKCDLSQHEAPRGKCKRPEAAQSLAGLRNIKRLEYSVLEGTQLWRKLEWRPRQVLWV